MSRATKLQHSLYRITVKQCTGYSIEKRLVINIIFKCVLKLKQRYTLLIECLPKQECLQFSFKMVIVVHCLK